MVRKRRRGTAIVETGKGILVTSGRKKVFILPGGGANKGETRTKAAMRELREETGLKAYSSKYLFKYAGVVHKSLSGGHFQDHHTVIFVKAKGHARPRHEVKYIDYYKPGSKVRISGTTRKIIDKYYQCKGLNKDESLISLFWKYFIKSKHK